MVFGHFQDQQVAKAGFQTPNSVICYPDAFCIHLAEGNSVQHAAFDNFDLLVNAALGLYSRAQKVELM